MKFAPPPVRSRIFRRYRISARAPDAAQRAAFAEWCAADPGPMQRTRQWVPALWSSVKNAAPRPGHGKKKPRPAGGPGEAWISGRSRASDAPAPGPFVQAGSALLDDLNDAAGTRFDQHGLAVYHGGAVRRGHRRPR